MEIIFKVSTERIKFGKLIAMQKGDLDATREIMIANMVQPNGEYMKPEEARAVLDELNMKQFEKVAQDFGDAIGVARNEAIPPNSK